MRFIFDIETTACDFRDLSGITTVHCMSYAFGDLKHDRVLRAVGPDEVLRVWDMLANQTKPMQVIGHNIVGFDLPALMSYYTSVGAEGPGVDLIRELCYPQAGTNRTVVDTLLLTQLAYPDMYQAVSRNGAFQKLHGKLRYSHSLKAWGQRLGVLKDTIGDATSEDTWEKYTPSMGDYCDQDVEVTKAILRFLSKQRSWLFSGTMPDALLMETRFAQLMRHQQTNGVWFDIGLARSVAEEVNFKLKDLQSAMDDVFPPKVLTTKTPDHWLLKRKDDDMVVLRGVTKGAVELARKAHNRSVPKAEAIMPKDHYYEAGPMQTKEEPFNAGSRQQIAERLKEKYGWEPTEFTEPTDSHPDGQPKVDEEVLGSLEYPEAKLLAEYLNLTKVYGMLAAGDNAWLSHYKQETGRIHGKVNTLGTNTSRCSHNSPNLAQVPSTRALYGEQCRAMFGPRPGWKQLGCDASGLELRLFAGYLGNFDNGRYAKVVLEGDAHTSNQEAAGLPTRDDAKTFIYAFLYGAGNGKLGSIAGGSSRLGKRLRESFLEKTDGLSELVDAVKSGFNKRGFIFGLDRRRQYPRSDHSALNLLLQGAGAMVMKQALIEFYFSMEEAGFALGEDWDLLLNVHDEFQIEVHPDVHTDEVCAYAEQSIGEAGRHFGLKCRLDGEAKVGTSWKDTH